MNTEAAKVTAAEVHFASLAAALLQPSVVQHLSVIFIDLRVISVATQPILQPPVEVQRLPLNKYMIHRLKIAFKICMRMHACVRVCICPDWANMNMHI